MAGRIVVFFSRSGRTRAVAEGIARELGAPLGEILLKKIKNRIPTFVEIRAMQKRGELPSIHTDFPDLGKFEEIILGGPVWGFDIAPPVLSLVESVTWSGKRVHLFVTEAGLGGGKALAHLERALKEKGAQVGRKQVFPTLLKGLKALQLTGRNWAKTLKE
ncbi:MAG: flavodoxin family protein [Candidatus Caldatribacteriaceae bacterium]